MSLYTPEGVDMRRADPDYQTYEGYLPTVPNPLDVKDPATEVEAAERVSTYLYQAKGDVGTADLQWHECQVQIHPWSITQEAFNRLLRDLPVGFPHFEHELAYEVWFSEVVFSIQRKEDQP